MKLGNVEVNFSFTNTSNLRRLQEAYKKVLDEDNKSKKKNLGFIEQIDEECNIARNFFNEVFGEGIDKKIFGEENDYEIIMDTLEGVMQEYEKQAGRIKEKYANIHVVNIDNSRNLDEVKAELKELLKW